MYWKSQSNQSRVAIGHFYLTRPHLPDPPAHGSTRTDPEKSIKVWLYPRHSYSSRWPHCRKSLKPRRARALCGRRPQAKRENTTFQSTRSNKRMTIILVRLSQTDWNSDSVNPNFIGVMCCSYRPVWATRLDSTHCGEKKSLDSIQWVSRV